MADEFVSVIVATRNRQALLAQTLEALAGQSWPRDRFEIVVADNGSTDGTRAVVDRALATPSAPAIRYLFVADPGKSRAVNTALDVARGDILAFTDDDVTPDGRWIERLVAGMAETGAEFAAGRLMPRWELPPPAWISPALYGVLAVPDNGGRRLLIGRGLNEHVIPIGANMAVHATAMRRVGGLRADLGKLEGSLRTGEDHELFLRLLHAGYRGVYEPTAVAGHWVSRDRLNRQYFRQWLYQNGRVVARLDREYPADVARLLGVPRYLWRRAAADVWGVLGATLRARRAARFAAFVRALWFAGYLHEAWLGPSSEGENAMRLVEQR